MSPKLWVFSIKVYVAAMLALWVAFDAATQYPYWAMMVVYILALPTTGAMRQKALYMVCGSALGAFLGVASSAIFVTSEIAQLISMAVLAATAGYFSLRDRLPSFYFFLLAALTCMLVALPGLTTPDQAFYRGVERVQDVAIGTGCLLLMDLVVLPVMIGPQFVAATDAWIEAFHAWSAAVLRGEEDPALLKAFLTKAAAVDPLARQMRYEGRGYAWTRSRVGLAMRACALRMVPTVALLDDLGASAEGSPFMDIRRRLAAQVGDGSLLPDERARLRSAAGARAVAEARCIRRLALVWRRLARWRRLLSAARPPWLSASAEPRALPTTLAQVDARYALRTSFAVLTFFAGMCTLWSLADWPTTSAIGLLLGTVFLIISGQADDPVPLLRHIYFIVIVAFAVDVLYLTVILPHVTSFVTLALVLAPVLLLLGTLIVKPGGLLYAILPMALIRLGNTGPTATLDMLVSFASGIAVGLAGVLAVTLVFRRLAPGTPVRRVRAATRALVARTAGGRAAPRFPLAAALDHVVFVQSRVEEGVRDDLALIRIGAAIDRLRGYPSMHALIGRVHAWLVQGQGPAPRGVLSDLVRHGDRAADDMTADLSADAIESLVDLRLCLSTR